MSTRPQRDGARSRRLQAKTLERRPSQAGVAAPTPIEVLREAVDQRLRRLSEIGHVLARDEHAERAVPAVAAIVGREVALRSIVLVTGRSAGTFRTVVWKSADVSTRRMRLVRSHALRWSSYMAGEAAWTGSELASPSGSGSASGSAKASGQPPRLRRAALRLRNATGTLLTLPLSVTTAGSSGTGVDVGLVSLVGTLQVETAERPCEADLVFMNQIAGLFAAAIDRRGHQEDDDTSVPSRAVLRGQLDFTSSVMDSLGEGVLAVDALGQISFVNPAARRLLGWSGESFLGTSVHDAVWFRTTEGIEIAAEESPLTRALRTGEVARTDDCLFASKGRPAFPVTATVAPLRSRGAIIGAVVVFQDILEVRRSERIQRFLALSAATLATSLDPNETLAAVSRLPVPALADVCFIDLLREDGSVERLAPVVAHDLSGDRSWAMIHHPSSSQASGRAPSGDWESPQAQVLRCGSTLFCSDVHDVALVALVADPRSAEEEERSEVEVERSVEEDPPRQLSIASMVVVPLKARGRLLGVITFAMTDSQRRFVPADLRDLEEVAARAAMAIENATLYKREQMASRSREDILAVVSHDLRNPLAVVIGGAALLLEMPMHDERRHRTILAIRRAAQRMRRLIGDLLDASCIDGGRLSIEIARQPADALVRDAVEMMAQPPPKGRRLTFRCDAGAVTGASVVCDRDRIMQVFGNLIGNAIKFTPDGGTIRVGARRDQDDVVFFVADDGPGIAPEHLPHVFERFWQLQPPVGPRSGLGLGLSISQGIVETHGGRIWAESRLGVGSTFFFSLHAVLSAPRAG